MPRYSKWPLCFRFPHKYLVCTLKVKLVKLI
jgi:hypothetical protein